ncbi:hypothetical protein cyc_08155 [Cyclospora cayetanensis]|uniref:Uncharacterized protein n=1 Tax=Cyclospora cayetanensis TaxID=88456 RepID=A0A1D3D8W1_9EIME|nr:hypothetical protein cyc_08155 [Cyclospora cayetanensis]
MNYQRQQPKQKQQQPETEKTRLEQTELHSLPNPEVHAALPQEQILLLQQQMLKQQLLLQQHLEVPQQQPQWNLQQQYWEARPSIQQEGHPEHPGSLPQCYPCARSTVRPATESQQRVQQLLQIHHAAVELQHRELALALRELELLYLPLLWGSAGSGSNEKVWDGLLRNFALWKGAKGRAFRAVGEGHWMVWPAERQDSSTARLQQQLPLLQSCIFGEQQQLRVLKHMWANGMDAVGAAAAALRGPLESGGYIEFIMRLPIPSCFYWTTDNKGTPFVWRRIAGDQHLHQEQQPQLFGQQRAEQHTHAGAEFEVNEQMPQPQKLAESSL